MQSLFITATGTSVGKTYATLRLIDALASEGKKVGVFKPVETGVDPTPHDATILLKTCQKVNSDFQNLAPLDITAYTFVLPAAPFCADTAQEIKIEKIIEKYRELSQRCDILLVEGAGGLLVPVTQKYLMIDLIKDINARALLVTPSRLGCINETLLSIEALKARGIDFEWCVNLYEDKESFGEVTRPFYDAAFPEWWSLQEGIGAFVKRVAES